MLQVGGDSYFLEESLGPEYRGQLGVQDLYRNFAIVFLVVREVDSGHSATAQLTLNGISVERTLNLRDVLSH
jgi:hypothetical protein